MLGIQTTNFRLSEHFTYPPLVCLIFFNLGISPMEVKKAGNQKSEDFRDRQT